MQNDNHTMGIQFDPIPKTLVELRKYLYRGDTFCDRTIESRVDATVMVMVILSKVYEKDSKIMIEGILVYHYGSPAQISNEIISSVDNMQFYVKVFV